MLSVLAVALALVFAAGRPWGTRPGVLLTAGISLVLIITVWAVFGFLLLPAS